VSLALEHEWIARVVVAKFIAGDPGNRRGHRDDLLQEARLGLLRTERSWNPVKGAFSTHAFPWARQFVFSYWFRRRFGEVHSIERETAHIPPTEHQADARRIMEALTERFGEEDTRAFVLTEIGELTFAELAAERGVSKQRMHHIAKLRWRPFAHAFAHQTNAA
jgi:RNA polymerase sigma factor (sigma-70 family)